MKFDKEKFKKYKESKELVKSSKKRKIYKKQKCKYTTLEGERCKKFAIGKGMFCAEHGGVKDKDNLVPIGRTEEYMALMVSGNGTKFKPAYHPVEFIDLSREGLSIVEIAARFEVAKGTIKKWADTYEVFQTAYEIGQALHESWWLQVGKDNLSTRNFNTKLFKFLTGNKLGYSDKIETKNTNTNTHGVLVVPALVSSEDWKAKAQKTISEQTIEAEYKVENADEKA